MAGTAPEVRFTVSSGRRCRGSRNVFVLVTESPPHSSQRYVKGLIPSAAYLTAQEAMQGDLDSAKDALGRRPLRIWEPWTVYLNMILVNLAWLLCFGSIAYYLGVFARGYPQLLKLRSGSLRQLGLERRLVRALTGWPAALVRSSPPQQRVERPRIPAVPGVLSHNYEQSPGRPVFAAKRRTDPEW